MTDAKVNLADYYHWEEPGRSIRIYMSARMADRLQAEVLGSTNETGGILLGRTEPGLGGAVVIEDFVPVPCSHSGGPRYELSDRDTTKLEAALLRAALAACDSTVAPGVLGYYRSHRREGMSLSPSDLLAIESYFRDPASVFLLVKTVQGKACTAGFFFWEDGRIQSEFSALEVALAGAPSSPPEIAAAPQPEPSAEFARIIPNTDLRALRQKETFPELVRAVSPAPPAKRRAQEPSPKPSRIWRDFLLRAAIVSLAAVTVVLSVLTYLGATRPGRESASAATPAAAMLGLRVQRTPPDLLVTWNQKAPEIAAAHRATLFIREDGRQKILDLDKTQLTTGSVLYTPAGDDIQFRLEVQGGNEQTMAQSVRLLLPQAPAAKRK